MSQVAVIQMTSSESVGLNLIKAKELIIEACEAGAKFIVLPEFFGCLSLNQEHVIAVRESLGEGRIQDFIKELAIKYGVWIVGGSIALKGDEDDQKAFNASILWNDKGEIQAVYRKMHLFDVIVTETESYAESEKYLKGDKICVVDTPIGRCGIALCYDLRFPEIFRVMVNEGAEVIILPAAFTHTTGQKHWEVLLRARAIENQCYVIASNQVGVHGNGEAHSYGHSMIINPWGEVLAKRETSEGVILSEINLDYQAVLRQRFPVLTHNRIKVDYKTNN
ncbi:carbon-nitrogen hydrolase family protein [Thiotrichales bacterium 19S9-12]|nr:carbon-nitrogen hydrolase family protein [Thiotrichales bacterium 19S9-11]MCF6811684.1 carbon-nitrogen hydrolase family protein [Thiotrichales bacterium 19S9-12]